MDWLNSHKARHLNAGTNIRESYIKQTNSYIDQSFSNAPTYCKVFIDGIETGVRWVQDKAYSISSGYEVKKALLRPNTVVDRGTYVLKENDTWLTMFYHKSDCYPSIILRYCNRTLKVADKTFPCTFESGVGKSQKVDEDKTLVLANDGALIYVSANETTLNIKRLDRFVIDGQAWEVQAIDRTSSVIDGIGIISLAIKNVPLKEDELIQDEIEAPTSTYGIVLKGEKSIEANTQSQYIATVMIGDQASTEKVSFTVSDGTIDDKGLFTAPNYATSVKLTASYNLLEETLTIEIFDNNDWGWN